MDFDSIRLDQEAVTAGRWFSKANCPYWPEWMGDARLKVARISNPRFQAWQRTAGLDDESLEAEARADLVAEGLGEHVLVGWDGMTENGEPLFHSKHQAARMLRADDLSHFFQLVMRLAGDLDAFMRKSRQEAEGNSGAASAGNSGGAATESA